MYPINRNTFEVTNSAGIDANFGGTWCNTMVAKSEGLPIYWYSRKIMEKLQQIVPLPQ